MPLVRLVSLAKRRGLPGMVAERPRVDGAGNSGGADPSAKAMTPVAAMCAGADGIDDVNRLPVPRDRTVTAAAART
ncbi:hypothetical protein [Streptomyces sp. NPDC088766]|uniref:hypothetical protein n=1 Tax=Streptomyces sp. NPDC088766 TaxID=3365893 RepID=UPI00381B4ED6